MLKTHEKCIDNCNIRITEFPMRRAIGLATRMFMLLSPGLATVVGKDTKITELLNSNLNVGDVLNSLASSLSEEKVLDLILDLTKSAVVVDNIEIVCEKTFDLAFNGKFKLLFSILKEVLTINFSNFFPTVLITSQSKE